MDSKGYEVGRVPRPPCGGAVPQPAHPVSRASPAARGRLGQQSQACRWWPPPPPGGGGPASCGGFMIAHLVPTASWGDEAADESRALTPVMVGKGNVLCIVTF
jgi:hypothetical protein